MVGIESLKGWAAMVVMHRHKGDGVSSVVQAKSRLNKSILTDKVEIPEQVLELMRVDVCSAVNKYLKMNNDSLEMKWNRDTTDSGNVQFIEFIARVPLKDEYIKHNELEFR